MDGASDEKSHTDAVVQVQDALALFDTYGVPRPEGLSLSGKKQPKVSHDKALQLCHSCGGPLSFEKQCANCGHDFCYKCAFERACLRPSSTKISQKSTYTQLHGEHADAPETDRASTGALEVHPETPKHGPVTTNPFYLADRLSKTPLSAPQITKSSARTSRLRRLSDCVPRRSRNRSPRDSVEEVSPRQRDGEHNHGPDAETHSLCCSAPVNSRNVQNDRQEAALSVNLQSKVKELYRHAEDLHKAQYLREHLATAIDELDCDSDISTSPRSTVAGERPSMETRTKQLHKSRWHNLSEDSKFSSGLICNPHDIEQDVVITDSLEPEEAHTRGYSNHSMYTIPSSGKAGSNKSHSGTEETKRRQARSCLESSSNRHNSNGGESGVSSQTARRLSGGKEPNGSVRNRIPGDARGSDTLPDDQLVTNPPGPDLPSTTGYKRHRQNTQLCPRPQTPSTGPDPWPVLKKVGQSPRAKPWSTPNSVPWSRPSLRKVSGALGVMQSWSHCSTPSEWKRSLRRTDEPAHFSPSKTIPVGTPVSEWRSSLNKPKRITPRASHRSMLCESCNPTESKPSTVNSRTSGRCSHRNSHSGHMNKSNSNVEDPFTEPRLSVRAIEHSLAWKRVQEDIERRVNQDADEVPMLLVQEDQETESIRRNSPESCHSCNPGVRDMNLQNYMVSSEAMAKPNEPSNKPTEEVPARLEASAADELGIEGLTIVVHMRHRDDLVISTDLNGREYKGRG